RVVDDSVRQNFDGDVAIERRVAGAEHFAHSADTERRDDFIGTDPRSDRQRHGLVVISGKSTVADRTTDDCRPATCDLRLAPCDLRLATCDLRPATCDLRLATCDLRLATCDLRLATCDLRLATCDYCACPSSPTIR